MANCCNDNCAADAGSSPRYRRVLWIALWINAFMFGVEIIGGMLAGSVALLADAVDFAADATNYGLSLAVLTMGLAWRARAALVKGLSMAAFGLFVLGRAGWGAFSGEVPEPLAMGQVATVALIANIGVAAMLYAYREGDANMRSVWLCSRNDAIGNIAVMLAAFGVFGTGQGWPDIAVATIMALLALSAARTVILQARRELAELRPRRREMN